MRVLHCIPTLTGGGFASFIGGGAERQCEYLCCELPKHGVEVHVAALSYGSAANTAQLANSATLHALGKIEGKDVRKQQRNPLIILRVLRLIRQIKPDIVQSWTRPMDLFAGLAAVSSKRRWILSERCTGEEYYHGLSDWARRNMGRHASAIVANSIGGQKYWDAYAPPGIPREVISNVVPLQSIKAEIAGVQRPSPTARPFRILYVGRFDPQKNIHVMMEALCEVAASALPCEIVLLGGGPLLDFAKKMVAGRGMADKFDFKGYQYPPWQEMRRASMLVLASRHEGHPNVVCEAMAVGCPVIISRIPAHVNLFNEHNALFVNPDSPGDLARAIQKLAAEPTQALARAAAAEELVAKWSAEVSASRYFALYRKLCESMP